MLQQTQVSRVEQYYPRFLRQYPTLGDLARATPGQVRESWDGLGYYRRAANLHRFAVAVVEELDGKVPESAEALRKLPGVGRYTAGAVASFAYEQPEPAVDTNVSRVIQRVFFSPRARPTDRKVWSLAGRLVPKRGAWAFNQAIMELGALVCTARVARCGECPVRTMCRQKGGKGGWAVKRQARLRDEPGRRRSAPAVPASH